MFMLMQIKRDGKEIVYSNQVSGIEVARYSLLTKKWNGFHSFMAEHYREKVMVGWEAESITEIDSPDYVEAHSDGSVHGDAKEYVLKYPAAPLAAIKLLKRFLNNGDGDGDVIRTDASCGLHFHISLDEKFHKGKNEYIRNLYIIATILEDILFKYVPNSRKENEYCHKLKYTQFRNSHGKTVKGKLGKLSSSKCSNHARYSWINFVELYRAGGINTIEFRLLGNTKRYDYALSMFCVFLEMVYLALAYRTNNLQFYQAIQSLREKIEKELPLVFPEPTSQADLENLTYSNERRVKVLQKKIIDLLRGG